MAAAEVTTIIAALASQFNGNSALPALIRLAEQELEPTVFGASYDLACAYWVLHSLSGNPSGAAGAVASQRAGDIAVSYAVAQSDSDLGSTHWGKKLRDLIQVSVIGCRTGAV
jgi:hypothetical protein